MTDSSLSLHQIFALSQISGFRFHDWLSVFGFNPEYIVRLQILLSGKRTTLLDVTVQDPETWIPWFRNKSELVALPAIAPIGQLLDRAHPERLRSVAHLHHANFLYAKVGEEDAYAFPDLIPGSIVRADRRVVKSMLPTGSGEISKGLFLIEHARGLCCSRLQAIAEGRLVLLSTQMPYAQIELGLPGEMKILGALDLEIRSLLKPEPPEVPKELARHWRAAGVEGESTRLSQLLGRARTRAGLSFREASAMSARIAAELGDEQYFISPGSLSDYEASDTPPRHAHKAITICTIYGVSFSAFLLSIGLHMTEEGRQPIPDQLLPREVPVPRVKTANAGSANGVLRQLLSRSGPLPFFLKNSVPVLSGLPTPTLNDFFWVDDEQNPIHPLLLHGLLLVVNRHRKKPLHFRSRPIWQQPLYVLLRRDGSYICGCCSLENGTLIVHSYPPSNRPPEHLSNHRDGEVIGQVVTVAREL